MNRSISAVFGFQSFVSLFVIAILLIMSDAATVSAGQSMAAPTGVVPKAKNPSTKKKAAASKPAAKKHTADHPKYSEMVHQALSSLKERGGSSRQAVLKYIMKNFSVGNDENVVNTHLKMALRAGVKNATLKQSKGSGATGSFRLGEEAKKKPKAAKPAAGKKTPKKAKAPPAAKIRKAAAGDKSAKSPAKKMTKKSSVKSVATSSAKKTPSKPKVAAPKKSKNDKPKKAAAVKKVKADKPKTAKVAKKPVAKKTPVAKKPVAAKKA